MRGWEEKAMNFVTLLIQIVVAAVILAPVLYSVGKLFVGNKAKFSHAVWIGVLGVIIGAVVGFFLSGIAIVGTLIMIVVWLVLITHFFKCGLIRGIAIAVIAGIIYLIISLIISAILVALGYSALPSLW